ncbi:MAG: recombinase family protein [Bacteroidota bacterium]
MMNTLKPTDVFARFGRQSKTNIQMVTTKEVVIYTRVSSKEQADKNLSLETQKRAMDEFARRSHLNVAEYFGGTYESAKTDGRKEFQRMLEYIKKRKGKISQILVYSMDRFSRTGGGAIKLATDLREKYGVSVFAVTQPTDTANPSGVLHQNIQLLFSEYDNQLRKQKAMAGMKEKFEKGIWVVKPPQGYDIIRVNDDRKIVLNEEGKKIKKAWDWKLSGMKNEAIVDKLRAMGVNMYKQQIHKIFMNPFYCGMISHGMLNGRVIEGVHEQMVSKDVFLKVNGFIKSSTKYGVPHCKENENVPLKIFVKCSDCEEPFTGYVVKSKGLYYYKCRTKGCKCNRSAKQMHDLFTNHLGGYAMKKDVAKTPLLYQLVNTFERLTKGEPEQEKAIKEQLNEVGKKIETIEENHYLNKMAKDAFDRFFGKYNTEKKNIMEQLEKLAGNISNPKTYFKAAIIVSQKLCFLWEKSNVSIKERVQKLVFPEGLFYEREKGAFRTPKVNLIFKTIDYFTSGKGGNKKGLPPFLKWQSRFAERVGFEPTVPL